MARQARQRSNTGTYHVLLRGINHQTIFEDQEDREKFIEVLRESQKSSGYILYAYCLMDNHIHLLMKEGGEELGNSFKRIGARYVYWYNWKYERRGHLFQDRFKSEIVENDEYFMVATRYIHQNPLKAGLIARIEDYKWSSYKEYIGKPFICDIDFGLDMISTSRKNAIQLFKEFNSIENKDTCLEYDENIRLTDSEAREIITKISNTNNHSDAVHLEKDKRTKLIKESREMGVSMRQLSRLTGITLGVIRRVSVD